MTPAPPFTAHKDGHPVTPVLLLDEPAVQQILIRQAHAIATFVRGGGRTWIISVLKGAAAPTRWIKGILTTDYPSLLSRIQWTEIQMQGGGVGQLARVLRHSPHRHEFDIHYDQFLVLDELIDEGNTALGAIRDQAVPATSTFCYLFQRQGTQLPSSPKSIGRPELIVPREFPEDAPGPQPPFVVCSGTNLPAKPVDGIVLDDGDDLRERKELWAVPWGSYLVRPVPVLEPAYS